MRYSRRPMRRPLTINVDADLPRRAKALDEGAIAQIFGGCSGNEGACRYHHDCCGDYWVMGAKVLRLFCFDAGLYTNGRCRWQYVS